MDRDDRSSAIAGTGVTRYVVALVIVGFAFVVLAAQNSQRAEVDLLVWDAQPPLYAVAIVSALAGALVAVVGAALWRHRRRNVDGERRAATAGSSPGERGTRAAGRSHRTARSG